MIKAVKLLKRCLLSKYVCHFSCKGYGFDNIENIQSLSSFECAIFNNQQSENMFAIFKMSLTLLYKLKLFFW